MLRTTTTISSIADVPREWVFEYYLTLPEKLCGQDLKISSPWNPGEKNPSFFVYYSKNNFKYMFKDFSTDRQGDGVNLVKELFNLSTRGETAHKIINDYSSYLVTNPTGYLASNVKALQKYKVTSFTARNWTVFDEKFWMAGLIGSKDLNRYHVQALSDYTLVKEHENEELSEKLLMNKSQMYGYFRKDGVLTKIYQPFVKFNKFIKVLDYIQGSDQLTFKVPYLVIIGSLKDLMAFNKLRFKNIECVCPDSENILIPERIIKIYKERYTAICTLFDNDAAGIQSMAKYEKEYNIPGVHLVLEKDMFDNIREHGVANVRIHLYPLLTQALMGKTKQL